MCADRPCSKLSVWIWSATSFGKCFVSLLFAAYLRPSSSLEKHQLVLCSYCWRGTWLVELTSWVQCPKIRRVCLAVSWRHCCKKRKLRLDSRPNMRDLIFWFRCLERRERPDVAQVLPVHCLLVCGLWTSHYIMYYHHIQISCFVCPPNQPVTSGNII